MLSVRHLRAHPESPAPRRSGLGLTLGAALGAGARAILGVVFLGAAMSKLLGTYADREGVYTGVNAFARIITSHGLVSGTSAGAAAWCTITVEVALGLWLISQSRPRPASIVAIALLAAFSVYLSLALRLGKNPACGCFGSVRPDTLRAALVRNAILVGVAMIGAALPGHSGRISGKSTTSRIVR